MRSLRIVKPVAVVVLLGALAQAAWGQGGQAYVKGRPVTPEALIERDLSAGVITRDEANVEKVRSILKPSELPDKYRVPLVSGRRGWACNTPRLRELQRMWDGLPESARALVPQYVRPGGARNQRQVPKGSLRLDTRYVRGLPKTDPGDDPNAPSYQYEYATTNFLIHWSETGTHALVQDQDGNANGIPDMVEWAGQYMEATWNWMVANGYRLPPGTTSNYYNVYFEYAEGWWGYTLMIDYPDRHSRSYISLSSDFSGSVRVDGMPIAPKDQMRCTASHEFYHACQFAYDAMEDGWWIESTATWVMDVIGPEWDAIDAGADWIATYLYYPEVSLDVGEVEWWHWYASVLWPMYLQSHYDEDGSIVREIWERCEGTENALTANKEIILNYEPGGFPKVWLDFLEANYRQDYPEAAQYPEAYGNLYYMNNHYTYPTGTRTPASYVPEGLGSNYIRFWPPSEGGIDLSVLFTAASYTTDWKAMLVGMESGGGFDRIDFTSGQSGLVAGFRLWYDEVVLIVSPCLEGYVNGQFFGYSYSGDLMYGDRWAPLPNPMVWQSAPHVMSESVIAMTAATAADSQGTLLSPPVSYQFEEVTGGAGGTSSGWQEGTDYADGGLSPNVRYGYRVKARDSAGRPNETGESGTVYVYTMCVTPVAPALADPSPTKMYVSIPSGDGNPPTTEYALYNVTDDRYVQADGSQGFSPYYAQRDAWGGIRITGLTPATSYQFRVKARNGDGIASSYGPAAGLSTLPADNVAPQILNAAQSPTWIKEGQTPSISLVATGNDRSTGGSDIVAAEYFVNTDPGAGNGTPLAAVDGDFDSPVEAVGGSVNSSGWTIAGSPYEIGVRVKDETGRWSTTAHLVIIVVDGIAPQRVSDLAAAAASLPPESVTLAVSEVSSQQAGHEAGDSVDGSEATYWATTPAAETTAEEITFDLGGERLVSSVMLYPSARPDLFPAKFRVKSKDGTEWRTVVSEYDYAASAGPNTWQFAARKATQVKISIEETPLDVLTSQYAAQLAEVVLISETGQSHTVRLTWTSPSDVGPLGRATDYAVKYGTNQGVVGAFGGTQATEGVPNPAAAGTGQEAEVMNLEAGTTYYFALKSVDEYENVSLISNVASAATPADTRAYVALDAPRDQMELDLEAPPAFSWRANILDTFKVQFSNVPWFPSASVKEADGRVAKTLQIGVKKGMTSVTPSEGQWKSIKKLANSMDGTLYWRVQATCSTNRALGVMMSEVFHEYGFAKGLFSDTFTGPYHLRNGHKSVWPNLRPQFNWAVSRETYGSYIIDFSASPDMNPYDKKTTLSITSKNGSRLYWRPSVSEWKNIKKKIAAGNGGLVYWRVRGFDTDKAYSFASEPDALLVDSPVFDLRAPAPRRDGTVMPGEVFTLDWNLDAEGYNMFVIQAAVTDGFLKGQTLVLEKLAGSQYTITTSELKKLEGLLEDAGTDIFYWRVVATDVDKTMTVPSAAQAVRSSETPAGGQ